MRLSVCLASLVLALVAAPGGVGAQDDFALPTRPEAWLNSPPISRDALEGKGVFFWFFEEGCPRCRAKWPELYELAEKYQDQPVLFIAVNSGNPRAAVQNYARSVGLGWPVIVDPDRQLEQAAGVGEISLQNITQVVTINGRGQTKRGRWSDLDSSVDQALAGASWRVPPGEVPDSLRNSWLAIEFNNLSAAAVAITKAMRSRREDVNGPAKKLYDAVMKLAEPELAKARAAFDERDKWESYRSYAELAARFDGYVLPDDVEDNMKTLAQDDTVKFELAALKSLRLIEKSLANPRARRGNQKRLKKLIEEFPETDAAETADEYLSRLGSE